MDKKIFFLLLFLTAIGVTTGCFFEIYLSGSGKDDLIEFLSGFLGSRGQLQSLAKQLLQKLGSGTVFLLTAFLIPRLPWIFPIPLLYLILQGFYLGFSAAMLLETFALKGILYVAVTLIPGQLLQILLFAVLLSISLEEYRILRHRKNSSRKALQCFTAGPYLYTYAAGLAILAVICLLQSVLLGAVTGP